MLQSATARGLGPSGHRPLGSTWGCSPLAPTTGCSRAPQLTVTAAQVARRTYAVLLSRSRPHPFGGALDLTRQQQQQRHARAATGGTAAALASTPHGDCDTIGISARGAPQGSGHDSGTAAAVNGNASAVAAAQLLRGVLEAALLPRLEAMEGRIVEAVEGKNAQRLEAMEGRIVKRMESGMQAQRAACQAADAWELALLTHIWQFMKLINKCLLSFAAFARVITFEKWAGSFGLLGHVAFTAIACYALWQMWTKW